ncbi:xanthine dehydrogenase family protein molybdopterin-binding subunit [Bradyrhizobium erythrophlei]|uniref:CO or xanthine dehydrogenase, Mo-binding subunit n=1 Tax=Bradyrhizobium erythrophlei TaxID=1437360 RepID=A0A1M7U9G6_9BRAD|nr:molybdopterin cofactor-binding domain-containing protein [Bradyrhizobium erythrophlei]SHN79500.1 CO or xanthine dehydrogenase, Mo-binding subunit [Bradyrhizobium erythrophlei]
MTKFENATSLTRRSVLLGGGALVVSIGAGVTLDTVLTIGQAYAQGTKPPLTPEQLSSYIAVNADGRVAAYFGKMDMGHGLHVAVAQIVAEELDVPFKSVKVFMADTATSVNQGGASGSTGIQLGGKQMRVAAAEARRVLVEMAAGRLSVPIDKLTVNDGVVSAIDDKAKSVSYAQLIGGQYFNIKLDWNKEIGNALYAPGKAMPKKPSEHKIVGQPIKREDVAPKVFCEEDFVTDVKVPNMMHGRMIRPSVAGSVPVKIDESSIRDIPGARVVWQKGFLGVVADREWDAIRAVEKLKVEWSAEAQPFPLQASLFDHIRKAPVRKRMVEKENGDLDAAFNTATKIIEADYEWPFQSHASMGPACSLVEIKDGNVTCWSGTQKSHFVRDGLAAVLQVPPDRVHVIFKSGPGSYGRNDADDCAMDAAILAQAVGRPVRLQYMRDQGTGWDPKGPASVHRAKAGLNAAGEVIAYEFNSKAFSRVDVDTNGGKPPDTLTGQALGVALKSGDGFGVPAESYEIANKRMTWETIPPLLDRSSPLRTSHLRDPVGPQIHFASESFIDELAAAVNADPIEFRLRHVKDPRDIAVIKAAAQKANWETRTSPRRDQTGAKVSGRGIAYAQRNGTRVAVIAEVDVDRSNGKIWARKFTVAHDCGQIINPDGLVKCVEGNIVQGVSRALWEEVTFDRNAVTSVDWITYPILDITETPGQVDVVLINYPDIAPSGAGEPSIRPVAAAIGNAIFDATGVRIRRVPFSPERVKAAFS